MGLSDYYEDREYVFEKRITDLETQLAEARALIEQMREALEFAKRRHYVNDDDNWYSCPVSGSCTDDNAGTCCNCGADRVNAIIEAAFRRQKGQTNEN